MIRYQRTRSSWSGWFKKQMIERLGTHEYRSQALHSLRNASIDLWREAGVAAEFRRAFVAHAAKDVQDKIYGSGLKMMPDVLAKEMNKVDLSWLE